MPFTVNDFEDLLRLLHERPDYRERLRVLLLPEEILTLPQLVRENTEAIRRLEEAIAQLAEAQRRTEQRVEELAEAQRRTDERVDRLAAKLEELAEAQRRTEQRVEELAEAQRRTDERVDRLAAKLEELAEAQRRTDETVARLSQRVEELAEIQRRQYEEFLAFKAATEARFERVEARLTNVENRLDRVEQKVDNLASQFGQLTNVIGASLEEEAQGSVSAIMRQKGYKAPIEGYPVRIDSVGEIDVVLPVESPEGEKLTVVAESKVRLSTRAVYDWANRMNSPEFRRRLKEAGVAGPYLVYMYAIRMDQGALDAARQMGVGVMSGRGELIEPRGPLPES